MNNLKHISTIVLAGAILSGCSTSSKRYDIDDDIAPEKPISVEHIEDAVPQYEPYSLGGNSDYTLRGQRYEIIKEPQGFTEKGQASWYGKKFHGHLTSNGEIYDMYSMTAAHKTLPIPSYVKVTNTDNGKSTIVRVNDRGPFHPGRIIDLSYAAATKLDVIRTGTANVEIEVIQTTKPVEEHKQKAFPKFVIQVASSQHEDRVRTLSQDLGQKLSVASFVGVGSDKKIHRVFLGPFDDYLLTQKALEQVKVLGYSSAFIKSQ
ncbi:septal ring lytic transglycosylase RlpA family protein [Vibrio sinensis]|uniref:Endolytic peptidoglycan transglycosylase RlpA n=1 Tax=Vibrio sinensis TaxID=2302434 RepID=A0A3A6QFS7_9VIBR|nr:septal ring lytic transglycosylase RlpA family protein [Vibrio sinensis]RJX71678.1 septal ring lytic transglycosylase RlpA family protein [Vibrio sinensis]